MTAKRVKLERKQRGKKREKIILERKRAERK